MLPRFRRIPKGDAPAQRLYDAIVARSREPIFYTRFGVPDTLDGRFDLFTLHAFVILEGLVSLGASGAPLGTELANLIFAGFDSALRELGVSDMGMSRRIKAMADSFYGRIDAYSKAAETEALTAALQRNLYRGAEARQDEAAALAPYILRARQTMQSQAELLLEGHADFGPLPVL